MPEQILPELLLIHKPKGISSFDVIRQLRRKTGIRKFGHAGTLDPLASGLMLIGVEAGTKKLTDLVGLDKEYIASVRLGEKRSTGDLEGEIIEEQEYRGDVTKTEIQTVLQEMIGDLELPVSAYSAIKKAGVPMYVRARAAAKKGTTVDEVPLRTMRVFEAELQEGSISTSDPKRLSFLVRFRVSSGTYVRSLVEELGQRLGYPAVMSDLVRTKVGEYTLEEAKELTDF